MEALAAEAWREALRRLETESATLPSGYAPQPSWPALTEYHNAETGKFYKPHTDAELGWVMDSSTPNLWALGGEGGGKTVAGIIRDLERAKVGCTGVLTSPDFEHFGRSLWPEFRRWIPWDLVVPKHRRMASADWFPSKPFEIVFLTGAVFFLGGMKESEVMSWEGPNVNFWHFDEPRRHRSAAAIKVIDGRVRILGPLGTHPQKWYTTTPRKHWMYDLIGPISEDLAIRDKDPRLAYKLSCHIIRLRTADNAVNLAPGFIEQRRQSLTEAEARELLEAEWEDVETSERFLPNIALWDRLAWPDMPPLTHDEPVVISIDGAIGSLSGGGDRIPDTFGISGVSRHPEHPKHAAVRFTYKWQPAPGYALSFEGTEDNPGPMRILNMLIDTLNVVQICYDPYQMAYAAQVLAQRGDVWLSPFSQAGDRYECDKLLYDMILEARLAHNGDRQLREHIDNANRKRDPDGRRMRMMHREDRLKIDLAVATAMACKRVLELNVE
jgi:hypothetical protein